MGPEDYVTVEMGSLFPDSKALREVEYKAFEDLMAQRLPNISRKNVRSAVKGDPLMKTYLLYRRSELEQGEVVPTLYGLSCERDYPEADFKEIKYLAVLYPGAGIGSVLMQGVKLRALEAPKPLMYLALCASYEALTFFKKYGFHYCLNNTYLGLSKSAVESRVEM